MNKKRLNYILGFMIALSVAGACEGPTGPQGLQGPEGEQGLQGEPGNANIMYSDWMDIEWNEEESSDDVMVMYIPEFRATQNFLNDGGIILMFLKIEGSSETVQFYALPLTTDGGNIVFRFIVFSGQEEGSILFFIQSLDGTAVPAYLWENFQIRYVLIPGSVNLSAKRVKWGDYETVTEYYGIPD